MLKIFQKIKEIVANPELRLRAFLDEKVRFAFQIELAGMVVLFIGLYAQNGILYLLGTAGFWYGFGSYVRNILRVHDEWKAEKEETSDSNEGETEGKKED